MMSYIAFKALQVTDDGVYSPCQLTRWNETYAPFLGRLTYSLSASSLEERRGIYAATLCEAWRYMEDDCRMFVVAPDPDATTEVGTKGWRTTCAIVLGEATELRDVARLILASHQAGYPQVPAILRWARLMDVGLAKVAGLSARDLVARSAEVRRMIRAAAWDQYATIKIGRSFNRAEVTWSTPIRVVPGNDPPTLVGQPYLKTTFRRWRFEKTLYTPSTLRIEVGEDWPPLKALCRTA